MKTNTATITMQELRKDPVGFVRQINDGKKIRIIYHSRVMATVSSDEPVTQSVGPRGAQFYLDLAAEAQASAKGTLDPNKSTKELYHELLDKDPKYGSR